MQNQRAKNLSLRLTLWVASITQNNNVYKNLSRIGKLRTSPSTNALSLYQERYYNNLNLTFNPMNPTPTNPTLHYFQLR
jgi:hypothetical protein